MAYILFISENKIKDSTAIGGNVDNEFLLPYIKVAQKKYIETKLGTDLFVKLQNDIQAGSLAGNYKTLVDDYIQDALAHWSFYESVPFLRHKIQNGNIVTRDSDNATSISREEAQDLREEIRNTAEFYTERLIEHLTNNISSFPEYSTNSGEDISPDKNAYYAGMNLERPIQVGTKLTLRNFLTSDLT